MNDDLGNFPTPNTSNPPQSNTYTPPTFEPTPDEIPSLSPAPATPITTPDTTTTSPSPSTPLIEDDLFPEAKTTEPEPQEPEPVMASLPPVHNSNTKSLITVILLLVAGVGISGSVFLYSQSSALKKQLTDITTTLEQQKTVITPSPTPTIIDIPTPTPTSDILIIPTPSATPTATITNKEFIPLALAPQALKVAINHEPNAQLILIKAENATNPANAITKYFFRNSLSVKKYFYVSINGQNESEINDNAIYVNPDNNIPSLNDLVLGNKMGIDFTEAYGLATKLCSTDCTALPTNAQFIKSGSNTIWQITLDPSDKKYIVQINSVTKEILFKSPGI